MLAPLGDDQRSRLVDAMAVVERLLTATLVDVVESDADHWFEKRLSRRSGGG